MCSYFALLCYTFVVAEFEGESLLTLVIIDGVVGFDTPASSPSGEVEGVGAIDTPASSPSWEGEGVGAFSPSESSSASLDLSGDTISGWGSPEGEGGDSRGTALDLSMGIDSEGVSPASRASPDPWLNYLASNCSSGDYDALVNGPCLRCYAATLATCVCVGRGVQYAWFGVDEDLWREFCLPSWEGGHQALLKWGEKLLSLPSWGQVSRFQPSLTWVVSSRRADREWPATHPSKRAAYVHNPNLVRADSRYPSMSSTGPLAGPLATFPLGGVWLATGFGPCSHTGSCVMGLFPLNVTSGDGTLVGGDSSPDSPSDSDSQSDSSDSYCAFESE
jgi:hypothetical protein